MTVAADNILSLSVVLLLVGLTDISHQKKIYSVCIMIVLILFACLFFGCCACTVCTFTLFHLLISPTYTLSLIYTHDPALCLPQGKVPEQWMGKGIPLAVFPHPETSQPFHCKPVGIGHS